jgi:hypothetical protein
MVSPVFRSNIPDTLQNNAKAIVTNLKKVTTSVRIRLNIVWVEVLFIFRYLGLDKY